MSLMGWLQFVSLLQKHNHLSVLQKTGFRCNVQRKHVYDIMSGYEIPDIPYRFL